MKSINIKRIAAVAAGVAMVGSVMASGLAVTEQGNVTALVSNIKANLDNAQVVVGTNGADISDGVQAAKIAAVLASVNYVTASGSGVTVGDKTVTLETTATATESMTSTSYPVALTPNPAGSSGHWLGAVLRNATLTKEVVPGILAKKSVSASVNGSITSYDYEDSIIFNGIDARYDEATSTANTGHGLYLNAPYDTGSIEYRVTFTGSGLPAGAGRLYATIPEIDLLGNTVGIDYANVANKSLPIYSGTKSTMSQDDEVTTADGYKVKLSRVLSVGTSYQVIYTATNVAGNLTEDSAQLAAGNDWSFFSNAVSVHVDSVGYDQAAAKGVAITRVTGGKQWITDGSPFILDTGWTVKHVEANPTYPGYLNYISLKYGASSATTFLGTVAKGLAQGTTIDGPKMADGTPKYQMQLKGFGSATSTIYTTPITVEGVGTSAAGSAGAPTHVMKATWVARDGSTQTLDPAVPGDILLPAVAGGATSSCAVTATCSNVSIIPGKMVIVNDKVVYLDRVERTSVGSTGQFNLYAHLKLGGRSGTDVVVGPFSNDTGQTATFTYSTNVNPISCAMYIGSPLTQDQNNVTFAQSLTTISTTDSTTASCDMFPNVIPVGKATEMTSVPYMDLRFIQGNVTAGNTYAGISNLNVTVNVTGATAAANGLNAVWPIMQILSPSGTMENVTVMYDSDAGTDSLTGLKAYGGMSGATFLIDTNLWNATTGALTNKLVDQAVSGTQFLENNKYDYTPYSIELDASVVNKLSVLVPMTNRSAILTVSKAVGNASAGTGEVIASEGQSVGSVKVKTINCQASATGSNVFSPTKVIMPEDLVVLDSAATATYQIVVGGPWVNSVAEGISGNDLTTTATGASYLIADANKLLVAGYTAADTASAADALINKLKA